MGMDMSNLLLGNGINIQFGGAAYTSRFIIKRIRYRAKLDAYKKLFNNEIDAQEIVGILDGFVDEANDIISGKFDKYLDTKDTDTIEALKDFKIRYKTNVNQADDIMLEDWLFLVHMFFIKNTDLENNKISAKQGFEQLLLDAIYNDGKVQEIYKNIKAGGKPICKYIKSFDNVFTLNYDNNIEKITNKNIYHLHGDFSIPADSENEQMVSGFIRKCNGQMVYQDDMPQCFCNALLNYSGDLKYKQIINNQKLLMDSVTYTDRYNADYEFRTGIDNIKEKNPAEYELIMTKIKHPELKMATDYHYDIFQSISGNLEIIGISPNNDEHIFRTIIQNDKLDKIIFYYKDIAHKESIEHSEFAGRFICKNVDDLWKKLGCANKNYNCRYILPTKLDDFLKIFNMLSEDEVTIEQVKQSLKQITKAEMKRLCILVKEDLKKRNPNNLSVNKEDFFQQNESISYIALKEGIIPSVLYLICVMNFDNYMK